MHKRGSHNNCISNAIREAERICKDRELRFTDLRRKVLEIIWEGHKPTKAYYILDKLKDMDYSAKPPTVYRTLDFLIEQGLIHKLESLNAYVGCSHPGKHHECYFLICSECQEIKECCDRVIDEAITKTTSKNKFSPHHTTLEINGKCSNCIKK